MIIKIVSAQDAKEILKSTIQKIQQTKSCSYLMLRKSKVTAMHDTIFNTGKVAFVINEKDTLMRMKLRIEDFKGTLDLYDGSQYVNSRVTDSTAFIWNTAKFNFFKYQMLNNPLVYPPLFKAKNIIANWLKDSESVITLQQDTLLETLCYHIKCTANKISKAGLTEVGLQVDLFVRKSDYFPMGHIQRLHSDINSAYNYEEVFLENVTCGELIDESLFTVASIPVSYTFKQQGSMTIKNYILPSELVPDLRVNSLTRDTAFKNLDGKIVLIVFIDADDCDPCNKTMQFMELLYSKFKTKNFTTVVLANHTFQNKAGYSFLKNEEQNTPSFFNADAIRIENRISIFPTCYLLDSEQKTLYQSEGYNNNLKDNLESAIKEAIQK